MRLGLLGQFQQLSFQVLYFIPPQNLCCFLIPVPIPAVLFGILYLVYSAYMAKRATDNIGHDATLLGSFIWSSIYNTFKTSACIAFYSAIISVILIK